ncbi:MAG: hypothetical protein Q9226_008651 [Calogaya cf. arnoldii]
MAANGLPTTQDSADVVESAVPIPKYSFFSLPLELRDEIYAHLIPNRIHIAPPNDFQCEPHWARQGPMIKPWALVSVSRQIRYEVRSIAYPPTPINIHLCDKASITAYRTWLGGLPEMSLRHIGINEYVDIDWAPDGPVPLRPQELEKLYVHRSEESPGRSLPEFGDTFGYVANDRMMKPSNTVAGLNADDVRRLVIKYLINKRYYLLDYGDEDVYEELINLSKKTK